MSKEFNININVFSKTAETKVPTLKKHSLVTEYKPEATNNTIIWDTNHSEIEDPDKKVVDKENVVKAYFYGK